MSDPAQTARELGADHGRTAAEAWWVGLSEYMRNYQRDMRPIPNPGRDWPQPEVHKLDDWNLGRNDWKVWATAYEVAFTAAVEATIRREVSGGHTMNCPQCGLPMSLADGAHLDAPYWSCDGPNDSTTREGCWNAVEVREKCEGVKP